MDRRRWVLRLAGMETPHFLRDYRRREADLWTSNPLQSEPFANFGEAIACARRLSHVLRLPIEAARVGVPRADACRCFVAAGDDCPMHEPLTPAQITEAALYAAREVVADELMGMDLDGVASRY